MGKTCFSKEQGVKSIVSNFFFGWGQLCSRFGAWMELGKCCLVCSTLGMSLGGGIWQSAGWFDNKTATASLSNFCFAFVSGHGHHSPQFLGLIHWNRAIALWVGTFFGANFSSEKKPSTWYIIDKHSWNCTSLLHYMQCTVFLFWLQYFVRDKHNRDNVKRSHRSRCWEQ